jgi:outer membrane protein assembly factor BamA
MADMISVRWLRIRVILQRILLPLLMLNVAHSHGQQPSPTKQWRLSKFEISGLQRCNRDVVMAVSRLQTGQHINVEFLEAATERLMKTGLFKQVKYNYYSTGDQVKVSFQVEEEERRDPIVFDNFVWFSDDEIAQAIRQELAFYDGKAPQAGPVVDSIKSVLERLLRQRGLTGRVEYMQSGELVGGKIEVTANVFLVKDSKMIVNSLRFLGVKVVREADLIKACRTLLGAEYSRTHLSDSVRLNIVPFYRQHGFLRVEFSAPLTRLEASTNSQHRIAVTIPVEEGPAYVWDKAEWVGNMVFSAKDLDKRLGMKSGKLADGLKIDAGLTAVRQAYWRKGYKQAKVSAEPQFDDTTRRVTYRITITEGPKSR